MRFSIFARIVCIVLLAVFSFSAPVRAQTTSAAGAAVETAPMPHSGDAADDPAIWLHPTNLSQSTIIGTDKQGGLAVYDLNGQQIQYRADGKMNNVDLRYNFLLGGGKVALVAASNRSSGSIALYRVNPATRQLENVVGTKIYPSSSVYGLCMYRSASNGAVSVIVTSSTGQVEQWELYDNGAGKVNGKRVRRFSIGSISEGCVADDLTGALYFSEERVGIWRYGAEASTGSTRTLVDGVGSHLAADIEGLTLYQASDGTGYLLASSQGNSSFAVYDRSSNTYIGSFSIGAGEGIDSVTKTDGMDVTNVNLGGSFAQGMLVVQDDVNSGANQNFKLVPWNAVAGSFSPPLQIDTSFDPRAESATPPVTPTAEPPTATPTSTPTTAPTATATPTPTSSPSTPLQITFAADADARVEAANPTRNFGTSTSLRTDGGSDPDVVSYLRFTVYNISQPILSAKVRVLLTSGSSDGPAVYTTSNSWSETGVTWNTRPAATSGELGNKDRVSANTWIEYDVSSVVSGDGTYSFRLATASSDGVSFSSREGSAAPQLVLTLNSTSTAARGAIDDPALLAVPVRE